MEQLSAGKLIGELSRAADIYFMHEFRKFNIGHAQIRTLFYVAHNEGRTQKELAQYLNLDKSSVTSQLQILERNGYIIRRISDRDARKQVISISEKAREILPSMQVVLESWTGTLLHGFSKEERGRIFGYLEKMKANAKKRLEGISSLSYEQKIK